MNSMVRPPLRLAAATCSSQSHGEWRCPRAGGPRAGRPRSPRPPPRRRGLQDADQAKHAAQRHQRGGDPEAHVERAHRGVLRRFAHRRLNVLGHALDGDRGERLASWPPPPPRPPRGGSHRYRPGSSSSVRRTRPPPPRRPRRSPPAGHARDRVVHARGDAGVGVVGVGEHGGGERGHGHREPDREHQQARQQVGPRSRRPRRRAAAGQADGRDQRPHAHEEARPVAVGSRRSAASSRNITTVTGSDDVPAASAL